MFQLYLCFHDFFADKMISIQVYKKKTGQILVLKYMSVLIKSDQTICFPLSIFVKMKNKSVLFCNQIYFFLLSGRAVY